MSDDKGCKFGRRPHVDCKLIANESGWCPRHEALVAHLGEHMAIAKELGVICEACATVVELDIVQECKRCDTGTVCKKCLDKKACCKGCADVLEERADELEDEAEGLRNRAKELRAGVSA